MSALTRNRTTVIWSVVAFLVIPLVLVGAGLLTYRLAYQNAYLHRQSAIDNCIDAARRTVTFSVEPGQSGLSAAQIAHIAATAETSNIGAVTSVVDDDASYILTDLQKTRDDVRTTWEITGDLTLTGIGDSTALRRDSTFGCSVIVLKDGTVHGPRTANVGDRSK